MKDKLPFVFGAQYYRGPTPEPECWEYDLKRMGELGFNAVKFWVQWRWSHRAVDRFYFDDIDRLMDLAGENNLAVTLNVIFDVSPVWLFQECPDAKQIDSRGLVVEPYATACRQIGGHPGPCYNHPKARDFRQQFMQEVVAHFRGHPAMSMWDVWNEPELCSKFRKPSVEDSVCYCAYCSSLFIDWLREKYITLDKLNDVWGRCYEDWGQVELPRDVGTFSDYIDWREFHLDTLTKEAKWRLDCVKEYDPEHVRYLHVVPNTMTCFSSISCVDDFAMAQDCDVFAATANSSPAFMHQLVSAGHGKICYNVESHINGGSTDLHQKPVSVHDFLVDFLSQIGAGIRGLMFWQYRSEVLGFEAPAWGLVNLDGSNRPVTGAAEFVWGKLKSYADDLMASSTAEPSIGIWKSRKNELFHFCVYRDLSTLAQSVEAYQDLLYWNNYSYRIIDERMLSAGSLDGIKLLIMPSCYYLTEAEAAQLDKWVNEGGVLFCEAHLAGYNATTGRHSRIVPGAGLAESWGFRETHTTSSYHLDLDQKNSLTGINNADVEKALNTYGVSGGKYYPIKLSDGHIAWAAERYAVLEGERLQTEGVAIDDHACLASRQISKGMVFYNGANLGLGAAKDTSGLLKLLRKACKAAIVSPTLEACCANPGSIHIDAIECKDKVRFIVVRNNSEQDQEVKLTGQGQFKGLFTEMILDFNDKTAKVFSAGFIDIFVVVR